MSYPRVSPARTGFVLGPLFTALFAAGTVLIIIFVFLPILDFSRISWEIARKTAAHQPVDQAQRELNVLKAKMNKNPIQKIDEPAGKDGDKDGKKDEKDAKGKRAELEKLQKKLDEAQKDYDKELPNFDNAIDSAQIHAQLAQYPYKWGMFAGYLILAIGSIGYLHPGQNTTRRVVGGVIICAQVVLIFWVFAVLSFGGPILYGLMHK
jgi:hypothetical protein